MSSTRRPEGTAREWFLVLAAGLVLFVIGSVTGAEVGGIGVLIALFGAFGLSWRLLKGR